ncbi:hypothetical protein [uncultured Desulfuromusa sp.]|uniref:hypothetical protein n=1 Tax=uncultured Desulfuromusa sp. TaxID=219183 RepID=UPI002AA950AC|nr:hypothetical protein [uncultured Desulfuromusa sp.]
MQKRISKLADGAKRDELQPWVTLDLVERFAGRIIDIDLEVSLCWGRVCNPWG